MILLIVGLSIVPSTSSLRAEPNDSVTVIFDQYHNLCWADEKARLDNFAIQLQNVQKSQKHIGYITVFAGRASCIEEAKYRAKRAKDWVVKRGINANSVVIRDGGYRKEVETIFSIIPAGLSAPTFDPELQKEEVSIHKCVDKVFARVLCLSRK